MNIISKIISVFAVITPTITVCAQQEASNWMTGEAKIKFTGINSPQIGELPSGSQLHLYGGSTSMSDMNGNLLFYSDGLQVFNRLYQKMPATANSPLKGADLITDMASQMALAVRWPNNDSLYILFHIYYGISNNFQTDLYYSIINIRANNGLGDVVERDQLLLTNISQKLGATLHCNKRHIWVAGHLRNSDKYFSFLITETGIVNTPILSSGNMVAEPQGHPYNFSYKGCLKFSPFGDRIAACHNGDDYTELCDYNTQTGQVSNARKLDIRPTYAVNTIPASGLGPMGVEFSPNSDKLYINGNYDVEDVTGVVKPTYHLYQFNNQLISEAAIQASKVFVDSTFHYVAFAMQNGIDGKTYINAGRGIHVINSPNATGLACNHQRLGLFIPYQNTGFNFPVSLQSYFLYPIIATNNCSSQSIDFRLQNTQGISSVQWNFGDPASGINNSSTSYTPTHIFSTPGPYRVRLVLTPTNGCANDTLYKLVHAGTMQVFLGNDTTVCQKDTLILKPRQHIPYASYFWSNGSGDSSIKITQSGQYWVRVSVGDCFAVDSINITVPNLPQFTLGNDTAICGNQPYLLQPQPNPPNSNYLWNTGATTPTVTTNAAGLYWLQLKDNLGCKWRDSINISFKTLPNFSLGNDTTLCQGQPLPLKANVSANSYLWSSGATSSSITVTQTGWYWCDATLNGCTYRDSLYAFFKPLPAVNLGPDTSLCEDDVYPLNVTNTNSSYLWQDGSTAPDFTVTQAGTYRVLVTLNACAKSDTVTIQYNPKPRVSFSSASLGWCEGMQIVLQPTVQHAQSLLWQNGTTAPTLVASSPGLYRLEAMNPCGTRSASIELVKGVCKLFVPTAFSPNGDGVNDVFKAGFGEGITVYQLRIFNRWGQTVFTSKDKNEGWDGKLNGRILPGVYAWAIEYRESASPNTVQRMKGTVVLVR